MSGIEFMVGTLVCIALAVIVTVAIEINVRNG